MKPVRVAGGGKHVRVVNVEQPVEAHVHAERHVDQVLVLLLQAVVNRRQAVDDVGDGQQLVVVGQPVLLEGVLSHVQAQEVHWWAQRPQKRRTNKGKVCRSNEVLL